MTGPTPDPAGREIHARIHSDALRRVTRMYSASIDDTFTELLQNARRAGATRVNVRIAPRTPTSATVTISDDGQGITDPDVLLSFGENGWDEQLVDREDAAGMGFLSLARKHSTVVSRPRTVGRAPGPGWRVELVPDHFLGKSAARITADDEAPLPHGTAISFEVDSPAKAHVIRQALRQATHHYPLPVTLANGVSTPPEREEMERKAFLHGAVHVERWRGLVLGVFIDRDYPYALRSRTPNLNFHGLTLSINLPEVRSTHRTTWSVVADVIDCPDLELVLPSRKEAVQTPFLDTLHEAARDAIYSAMSAHPDPRPAYRDWVRAREAGIDIAPPPAELRPWRPMIADTENRPSAPDFTPVPGDALIVAEEPESPEGVALWHAARKAGIDGRLFEPHQALEGFEWFQALDQIKEVETRITLDGQVFVLENYPLPQRAYTGEAWLPKRPDRIVLRLGVQSNDGDGRAIDLPTDVCFAGEDGSWIHESLPVVTASSQLKPHELAELLTEAFYSPSDDYAQAGSPEQQKQSFDQEALHLATTLLCSEDDARRISIADIVSRDVLWLAPADRDTNICIRDRKITVTFDGSAGQAHTA